MIPGKDFVGVGVGALILYDNKVLLLLRSAKCRNNVGLWTIPVGMVEVYESIEDAVRREVMEETGLSVASTMLITVSDRFFDDQHWITLLYLCRVNGHPVNKEPDIHLRLEYFDIDNLPENITRPTMDAIIAYKSKIVCI